MKLEEVQWYTRVVATFSIATSPFAEDTGTVITFTRVQSDKKPALAAERDLEDLFKLFFETHTGFRVRCTVTT